MMKPGDVLLFQGDSITDALRDKTQLTANSRNGMGCGYAMLVAAHLLEAHAGQNLRVLNRGVGGDKLYRMAERWQADCIDLRPTVVSVLIGINDVFDHIPGHAPDAPHVHEFEQRYRALLRQTVKALPGVKLVIGEPFAGACGEVTPEWEPICMARRQTARQMADEFQAVFVPYQSVFDAASARTCVEDWLPDGVHPSIAGQMLMARAWLDAVQQPG